MPKLLTFMGSPRQDGNTARLHREFLEQAFAKKIRYKSFATPKKGVRPCSDCGMCTIDGHCHVGDNVSKLFEGIPNIDGFVIFSPIYFFQFSAQTKAFVDRLGFMESWEGRTLSLVLASGSAGRMGGADLVVESMKRACEYKGGIFTGYYNKVTDGEILEIDDDDREGISKLIEGILKETKK